MVNLIRMQVNYNIDKIEDDIVIAILKEKIWIICSRNSLKRMQSINW